MLTNLDELETNVKVEKIDTSKDGKCQDSPPQDSPLGGNPEVGNPDTISYQDYPPQL